MCATNAKELPIFSSFPCEVQRPQPEAYVFGEVDIRKKNAEILRYSAKSKYRNNDLKGAIQFQYWACQKDPNEGLYDLACYYSLDKQIDNAVYCLQQAAVKEGVKYDWAMDDRDLIPVMNSKHWDKLRPWLKECEEKWASSKYYQVAIIRPKSKSKILLIGFHGYGSKPSDFAETAEDQAFADKFGVTIISVSASVPWGLKSFSWSENIKKDFKHVDRILKAEGYDLESIEQSVCLIGFSQGAQLSTEILARYPDVIKGIIAICPGGKKAAQLEALEPKFRNNRAVIVSGSEESKSNIQRGLNNKAWLESKGAKVLYQKVRGMGHSFPETYYNDLEKWMSFIMSDQ